MDNFISHLENSVDSDQLASEKPADQYLPCFPLVSKKQASNWEEIDQNWRRV